jgi:hypothetical protein
MRVYLFGARHTESSTMTALVLSSDDDGNAPGLAVIVGLVLDPRSWILVLQDVVLDVDDTTH